MRPFHFISLKNQESGIIMPFVIGFLVILTTVGATLTQTSTQTFNNSVNFSYNQIAHVASKAAIDYAEEQYELNASYNGTAETDLYQTGRYRSTIEVEVLYNQGSSAKRIRATGRVYISNPLNGTADFAREIQASIIRNGAVAGNPADYEPVLWLDASQANTLFQSSSGVSNETITALWGSSNGDIVEERGDNAATNVGALNFGSDDLEFSYAGYYYGDVYVGLRFRDVDVPQGTTINSATIQFTTDETYRSGPVEILVEGVATDDSSSWSGSFDVSTSTTTAANVTWTPDDWNDVGESGADERVDVTAIVQEIINRGGWSGGNDMSFTFSYVSGSGIRTAESGRYGGAPVLDIEWGTASGGGPAVSDGDPVGSWLDFSGENNDADLAYGVDGELKLNQINGYDAVRFNGNTILRSALSPTISDDGITAFAVMLPRTSTPSNGRFVTAMNTAQSSDSGSWDSARLFYRYGSGSSLAQYYRNSLGETLSNAVDDSWSVYTSRISDNYYERLLEDGVDNNSNPIGNVNYDLNEIFVGGTRNGSSGADYSNMDLAELIVYDNDLVCSQMQQVENYLGLKYGISITDKGC